MRLRTVAALVAIILAGMAAAPVSGARPFDGGTSTATCGDGTVTATPGKMWPPNHKWKPVTLVYEDPDDDGDTIGLEIDAVTHEEEGFEKGSTKRHEPDSSVILDAPTTAVDSAGTAGPSQSLSLRKERLAKPKDGRTYSITVTCTDAGDVSLEPPTTDTAVVTVFVPHSRRR